MRSCRPARGMTARWWTVMAIGILLKTDAVVEGVHFEQERFPVGRSQGAGALSQRHRGDEARHALITLGLPDGFDPGYLKGVYAPD